MKYTLYKDDKFIMQRKHFYPIKMYLIKDLGIKNIYISYTDLMDMAKKIIIKRRNNNEFWISNISKQQQRESKKRERG